MSYAVLWNDAPMDAIDLAIESAPATRRVAIVDAVVSLTSALGASPMEVGESREDLTTRVIARRPVTLYYRVIERLNAVRVFAAQVELDRG